MTRHADFLARTGISLLVTPRSVARAVVGVGNAGEDCPVPARAKARLEPPAAEDGAVIAVVSATGGCGKTFFATNLAYHLQAQGRRVCVLDLDLQFGEVSAALRLDPTHTIRDLLAVGTDSGELGRQLEKHLTVHESGIRVLAAPETPEAGARIEADDVARVIEAARSRFDDVIVDAPAALRDSVLVSIELADRIFAMTTFDLPSIRNLGVMLSTLRRLGVPDERVHLLLNKVERNVGIDVAAIQGCFPQRFAIVIPYGREVSRALNRGRPVLADAPRCEVSKALAAGLAVHSSRRRRFARAA